MTSGKSKILYIGITCGLSAPYVAGQLDFCLEHLDRFVPVLIGFNPIAAARLTTILHFSRSVYKLPAKTSSLSIAESRL